MARVVCSYVAQNGALTRVLNYTMTIAGEGLRDPITPYTWRVRAASSGTPSLSDGSSAPGAGVHEVSACQGTPSVSGAFFMPLPLSPACTVDPNGAVTIREADADGRMQYGRQLVPLTASGAEGALVPEGASAIEIAFLVEAAGSREKWPGRG